MRAIILGIDEHPRCVATIRSLGRVGIDLVGIDHLPPATRSRSRYIKKKYFVSSDSDLALKALESLGQDKGGLLIPTSDHYLVLVAKNYDRLSKLFTMTTPRWEILKKLMDRPQCYAVAQKAGVGTPRFFAPQNVEEMKQIIPELDFKNHSYLLKTKVWKSGPANPQTNRHTISVGPDAASMEERCLEIFSRIGEFPMIEEIVPGEADSCIGVSMVVDHNHEPVVWYCVKRLKLYLYSRGGLFAHPYELGANIYCESIHDDEASEAAKRLVRQANFVGLITVEFRRDSTNGSLKLIKVDPRPVRATSLSTVLGLDFPTTLYKVFTGGQVTPSHSFPDGIAWLWVPTYVETLWDNRFNNPVRKELIALLRNLRRVKAFGFLSARDPLPFLVTVKRMLLFRVRDKAIRIFKSLIPPWAVRAIKPLLMGANRT